MTVICFVAVESTYERSNTVSLPLSPSPVANCTELKNAFVQIEYFWLCFHRYVFDNNNMLRIKSPHSLLVHKCIHMEKQHKKTKKNTLSRKKTFLSCRKLWNFSSCTCTFYVVYLLEIYYFEATHSRD